MFGTGSATEEAPPDVLRWWGLGQGLDQVVADNIGAFSTGSAIEEVTVDLLRQQGLGQG